MSKKLKFNVSSYTARLIGRENVSTLDGAILELVKNTYDADANKCILYYDEEDKILYIMDNGCGMTEEIIVNHWMTIGNSTKKESFVSKKGRVQTGAKGIGRFALDRVSNNCTMYTKTKESSQIIKWKVNWNDFEEKKNITDVTADLSIIKKESLDECIQLKNNNVMMMLEEHFEKSGTVFVMEQLNEEYTLDLIESLRKSLASLLPPSFENEYIIYFFKNNKDTIKEAKIVSDNINNYDYKIDFQVYKNNNVNIMLYRNEFDLKDELDKIIKEEGFDKKDKEYFLGEPKKINTTIVELLGIEVLGLEDTNGTLYFNKNQISQDDASKFYYKDITGRQNYSKTFGGIKLYRDNFRVRPYGELNSSNYDWLLLGLRHNGSAAISHKTNPWLVAPNQITGIVNISRTNLYLSDQANRQGLVETKQFKALKDLIISIIKVFEEDRQYVGRKLNNKYEREHFEIQAEKEIEEIANNSKSKTENETNTVHASKAQMVIERKKQQIKDLEDENRMLRNLATTGILSNQYIHETKESVNSIGINVMAAKVSLKSNDLEKVKKYLNECSLSLQKLNSWFEVSLKSIRRDKRKMKFVNLSELLSDEINLWNEVLENQEININLNIEKKIPEFKCFPYEIESIISNLIANSIHEFKGIKNKEISIDIKNEKDGVLIGYKDNGPGLAPNYKNNPSKILEPFETGKRNTLNEKIGTGMGMWIINNIVNDYDGSIDLSENTKSKSGFSILIKLKSNRRDTNV